MYFILAHKEDKKLNKKFIALSLFIAIAMIGLSGCGIKTNTSSSQNSDSSKASGEKVNLTVYGAGTLSVPFKEIDEAFQKKYPNVTIQPQFGGSVGMVKKVTDLSQQADVVAVADYSVIPKYMFGQNSKQKYTNWYIGFANNAITFVYTDKSKGQDKINENNWYQILAEPGVQIGRSNPDTDPSGYITLQMLNLAGKYYNDPNLAQKILNNAPQKNMRDTETNLLSALQSGQIDYLATYRSDAIQHHLKYLELPNQINLSDPNYSNDYSQIKVNTKNGSIPGKPIVYALTIPDNAPNAEWAEKYVAFLLGSDGQAIMKKNGFGVLSKPYANDVEKVPSDLRQLVTSWPKQ